MDYPKFDFDEFLNNLIDKDLTEIMIIADHEVKRADKIKIADKDNLFTNRLDG